MSSDLDNAAQSETGVVDDPTRLIYEDRRESLIARLRDEERIPEGRAESLFRQWEDEASERGLRQLSLGFWTGAKEWIRERASRDASRS